MAFRQETISIVTNFVDNVSGASRKVTKSIKDMGGGILETTTQVEGLTAKNKKLNTITTQTTRGMKKFRAEFLSVMFLGMGISRVFGDIVKQQMDLWGITDLLSASWATVMQPAMELITPMLYDLLGTMMDLPESTKMVIGLSVIGFDIIGQILSGFASLYLGLQGINMLFPSFLGNMKAAGGLFGWLSATGVLAFLAIAAIAALVIYGIWSAWKSNFGNIRGYFDKFVEGIKQVWNGFKQFWTGVWNVIVGVLTGDFKKIKQGFSDIWNGAKDVVLGVLKSIWSAVSIFSIGVLKGILDAVDLIFNAVVSVVNKLTGSKFKKFNTAKDLEGMLTKKPQFRMGGIIPGNIGQPVPIIAHGGERVIPTSRAGQQEGVVITNTYNVTVSDKREFESMLKQNNIKLVNDIRRQIET